MAKSNQSIIWQEIEDHFADAQHAGPANHTDLDKCHGRIEEFTVTVPTGPEWLEGSYHFPGKFRLSEVACVLSVKPRTRLKDHRRGETHNHVSLHCFAA